MCAPLVSPFPGLRVAVTGHRPGDLFGYDLAAPGWQWLRGELRSLLAELGATEAVSGMALGVDQVFAEVALDAGVPLAAYVPFAGQDRIWPTESQVAYRALLARAARTVTVSQVAGAQAFLERNAAMVRDCDVVVAVWTGKDSGGTAHCVRTALAAGRPLVWLNPVSRSATLVV